MARRYKQEVHDFIREHARENSIAGMAELVETTFGIEMTYSQMKTYYCNHKLHAIPRKGRKRPEQRITTPEIDAFIRENIKGTGHQAMADLVNDKFGTSYTKEQMKAYYARNKLNSGLTGYFKKGQISFNKGLKQSDYMSQEAIEKTKATRFKKGHVPPNGRAPVGELRIRCDHKDRGGRLYYWEKVAQPNVWRMKHVLEWEKHNGPVPDGCMITFANGNSLDYQIENLIMETRAQHAIKNRWHIHGYDQESAQVANTLADIKMAANKVKGGRKKHGNVSDN